MSIPENVAKESSRRQRLLTVDGQVEPGAIVPGAGSPVGEDDLALVPALVALPDVGEIDAALAVAPGLGVLDQVHTPCVAVAGADRSVVPREHRPALRATET